ncbi:hypothetical protein GZ998_02495 [Actinomyces sp. 594]|uniref:hypothetical protein n=1 Tax=Actinomyces sp. 594 TaxID=2057793 RepID=UPI001C57CF32|nr:hypothetical protein [Actinomyces sp. 594]MBW3068388.1 hypothetical protein [Actinomyces sp. 594]
MSTQIENSETGDAVKRTFSERLWGLANRAGAPLVVSLTIVVLTLVGRLAWWGYQQLPPPRPSEPYCLVLTEEDVAPILGEVTEVFEGDYSTSGNYWGCVVNGSGQSVHLQAAWDADDVLLEYKEIGVSVLDTLSSRPEARVQTVGDATVVSWVGRRYAYAGWFEGTAALIVSSRRANDDAAGATQTPILEVLVIKRGSQLLDDIGFAATSSPTPDPYWTP